MERDKHVRQLDSEPSQYVGARIPLASINVLDQPRQTFENIGELAENIAKHNLLHPLIIARFTPEECSEYLKTINLIWGREHYSSELNITEEEGKEFYYVLLAGERRFRACKRLNTVGCLEHKEKFGEGPCYERHFGDQSVDVRLAQNVAPVQAIFIQASENIHMRVPPHEEAHFYNRLYRTLQQDNPNYPIARFAREVGRTSDTIRTALKYCNLPDDIQDFVENEQISYGIAGEIARLKTELNLSDEDLRWWAIRAIAKNYKVPDFREMVSNHIRQQKSGQTVFDLFSASQDEAMKRSLFKRVVAQEIIQGTWAWIHYFRRVRSLFDEGLVGKKDSPFSHKSPVRVFKALTQETKKLLPHLSELLKPDEFTEAETVFTKAQQLLEELELLNEESQVDVIPNLSN